MNLEKLYDDLKKYLSLISYGNHESTCRRTL